LSDTASYNYNLTMTLNLSYHPGAYKGQLACLDESVWGTPHIDISDSSQCLHLFGGHWFGVEFLGASQLNHWTWELKRLFIPVLSSPVQPYAHACVAIHRNDNDNSSNDNHCVIVRGSLYEPGLVRCNSSDGIVAKTISDQPSKTHRLPRRYGSQVVDDDEFGVFRVGIRLRFRPVQDKGILGGRQNVLLLLLLLLLLRPKFFRVNGCDNAVDLTVIGRAAGVNTVAGTASMTPATLTGRLSVVVTLELDQRRSLGRCRYRPAIAVAVLVAGLPEGYGVGVLFDEVQLDFITIKYDIELGVIRSSRVRVVAMRMGSKPNSCLWWWWWYIVDVVQGDFVKGDFQTIDGARSGFLPPALHYRQDTVRHCSQLEPAQWPSLGLGLSFGLESYDGTTPCP
ncbi:hypothetical protein KCU88_g256, partial [Aureobasidium melanogenum]